MLRGEDLLVHGGGGVPNVRVEECRIVGMAAVQHVVFCDPSHFFLVDDERKVAGLPAVSAGFEVHRAHCNHSDEFVGWTVLGWSCDSWEIGRIEAGFDHCVDGGGTRFYHGERAVGLRHALIKFVTTVSY